MGTTWTTQTRTSTTSSNSAFIQVEEFLYVAKSTDYNVERWTEEDLLEHQSSPLNFDHRTRKPLFTTTFLTMVQSATTLLTLRVIPSVEAPLTKTIQG